MHKHTVPAIDMSGTDDCHVINWNGDAYHEVSDLADITVDANGVSLSNKWFNLVFWGVANKTGEYAPLMCNLPTGSYVTQVNAENDVDGYDVTTIPHEFTADSTTGFLICRVTCKQTPAGTWTLGGTTDLRGVLPSATAGSATGGGALTDFADNQFTIYNVTDSTKIVDWDLSGITTANTRTITPADADMTLFSTTDYTDLTDGGESTLHKHPFITDTISELTPAAGVTIDSVVLKDGLITTSAGDGLTVGDATGTADIILNKAEASLSDIEFQKAGTAYWQIRHNASENLVIRDAANSKVRLNVNSGADTIWSLPTTTALFQVFNSSGIVVHQFSQDEAVLKVQSAVPADADLFNGSIAAYVDGSDHVWIKYKDGSGTTYTLDLGQAT
jgi:hypothetical protein